MEFSKYIDETNLSPITTLQDIKKLCDNAIKYNFKCVCIHPCNITYAKKFLENSDVKVCTVIGFPLGQNTTEIKILETKNAISLGADEIDMVINIGRLKDMDYDYIRNEISEIRNITKDKILKVIVETCYLTLEEIKIMTEICSSLKVNYIKTSTGFGSRGATIDDIDIMNSIKSDNLKIKASGGIKSYDDALNMINHGASRIGTSSGVKIIEEMKLENERN